MPMTRESIDLLIDLVENKLGSLKVGDKDDAKELSRLRICRHELMKETARAEQRRFKSFTVPFSRRLKQQEGLRQP